MSEEGPLTEEERSTFDAMLIDDPFLLRAKWGDRDVAIVCCAVPALEGHIEVYPMALLLTNELVGEFAFTSGGEELVRRGEDGATD